MQNRGKRNNIAARNGGCFVFEWLEKMPSLKQRIFLNISYPVIRKGYVNSWNRGGIERTIRFPLNVKQKRRSRGPTETGPAGNSHFHVIGFGFGFPFSGQPPDRGPETALAAPVRYCHPEAIRGC